MTLDENWVKEMGQLFAKRDHAKQMLERWEAKVREAEEAIIALRLSQETVPTSEPEPAPEPV
jgi:uncharacterized protein YfcZ (UPF0381/DUF406 family)